jgi:predicted HicB family RNase H-like nuclease
MIGETAPNKASHMTKIQSVDRDKFVVRFDQEDTRSKVQEAAAAEHMSMNTYIQIAIDEKLERGKRIDKMLDLVAITLCK